VADYAAVLLQSLRQRGRVEIAPKSADVRLYHIGNNQLHAGIYANALREPGVVVLHDAVLHHFMLGYLNRDDYTAEFAYNYGEWMRAVARQVWSDRSRSASDHRYFCYPMLRRIVERSRAVIVHNRAAAHAVLSHVPAATVVVIPHFFVEPPRVSDSDIAAIRRGFVDPGKLLAGIFGHLRESKRVMPVLRTASRLQSSVTLLLAGEFASSNLARAAAPYLNESWIRRVEYLPEAEFWRLAHAVDVCVNLRYPAAGESSGITTRFMGIGKPTLLTENDEVADLPENACFRIPAGLAEEAALEAALRWASAAPSELAQMGECARRHIRNAHDLERVADLYWRILVDCTA
jgi:glycosyltransferase involved in cell wall biosynthesis